MLASLDQWISRFTLSPPNSCPIVLQVNKLGNLWVHVNRFCSRYVILIEALRDNDVRVAENENFLRHMRRIIDGDKHHHDGCLYAPFQINLHAH